jgi:hypothetical protein
MLKRSKAFPSTQNLDYKQLNDILLKGSPHNREHLLSETDSHQNRIPTSQIQRTLHFILITSLHPKEI